MDLLHKIDSRFIHIASTYYPTVARVSLFIIYFYFGLLKLIGASPANELAVGFTERMGFGDVASELYLLLAAVECTIGLLLLFPKMTRLALFIMFGHMLLVSAPLLLYPEAVWVMPFVPNLEGQYIIKNAALVALALGLVASTQPLAKK